ncbi:hypothetical protein MY1_0804 [Nitrosarchaeum koreense MY1]|uniref:Uncharacterized protein n=1 Tax=Nitrosarchaeum koreense MY1 TaxID=1001994 RepID=F9CWB4_9ARCH|nr:hypothetical protein MY1_0804 [Nitrosarchaeum koreense MY1]
MSVYDKDIQKMIGENVSVLPVIPKPPYSFGETLKPSSKVRLIE